MNAHRRRLYGHACERRLVGGDVTAAARQPANSALSGVAYGRLTGAAARAGLGEAAFAAWAEGEAMPMEQAAAFALEDTSDAA
jgi:hypothetical protein